MSAFKKSEQTRQATFKQQSRYFSVAAHVDGIYNGKGPPHPFCLPVACADENLYSGIRQEAITYFQTHNIRWHDGSRDNPSNNLCSSQVCCVNFLFPFMEQPVALAALLRPLFPLLYKMLPLERPGQHVDFEWIGKRNYLHERTWTRGVHTTSADAVVKFLRTDGKRQITLIEWKYAESYSSQSVRFSKRGTDRMAIYAPFYTHDDCPLDKHLMPHFEALFYDPFDQLMRQQFLANEMEKDHELDADIVSVLHIAPAVNKDFQKITSPDLKPLGSSVSEIWSKLVGQPDRFQSVSTESLFTQSGGALKNSSLQGWWEYITDRYAWLTKN